MSREMRYSGIKWIGDIPKTWNVARGKFLFSVLNGYAFDSNNFSTDKSQMPLIRIRDISNIETETYYTGDYPMEYLVEKEDILIGMDGDFNVSKWKGEKALLNQRVCKLRNYSDSITFYLCYLKLKMM